MVVGFIEGLLRMDKTCTLDDWIPSSTVVLFLFSCIQVFSTFCNSDLFDLSPCRSSFRSFKALRSCFTVIFLRFRKYSPVRSQQAIRFSPSSATGHYRNVRGLGKSIVVFRLFEKLRYSNERSTIFQSLYHEQKYLEEENGKMVALQISPKIESLHGLGRQAKKLQVFVWNFATFARFPFGQFSTENS